MENKNKILIAAAVIIVIIAGAFIYFAGSRGNAPAPATGTNTEGGLPSPAGLTTSSQNGAPAPSGNGNSGGNAFTGTASSSGSNAFTGSGTSGAGTEANGSNASPGQSGTPSSAVAIQAQTASGATKTFSVTPVQTDSRGDYLLSQYAMYDIVFFPGGSFLISLKDPDVNTARQKAETHFLSLLHIDAKTACDLTVNENVLYGADPVAAGVDYKMSFCPGAVAPLPQ